MTQSKHTVYWAVVSAALMVVGGFGPWAKVLGFSVAGTDGDGWLLIVAGLVAGALMLWKRTETRWALVVAIIAALIGLATSAYDLADISSVADDTFLGEAVSPAWGLYLSLLASLSLLCACAVALRVRHAAAAEAPAAAAPPAA